MGRKQAEKKRLMVKEENAEQGNKWAESSGDEKGEEIGSYLKSQLKPYWV